MPERRFADQAVSLASGILLSSMEASPEATAVLPKTTLRRSSISSVLGGMTFLDQTTTCRIC